jgi:hypothetical protein
VNTDSLATKSAAPAPQRRATFGRILAAAALYFAIVFGVGLVLGPARVLWLEPYLGETLAVLCEAPLLIVAIAFAAWAAPRWAGLTGGWSAFLWVGVIAFGLQQVADLAVGFGLRGMTLHDQLGYFTTPAGYIYAFTLVVFLLAPLAAWRRRAKGGEGDDLTAIKG